MVCFDFEEKPETYLFLENVHFPKLDVLDWVRVFRFET